MLRATPVAAAWPAGWCGLRARGGLELAGKLRLAEAAGVLSLATDLAMGAAAGARAAHRDAGGAAGPGHGAERGRAGDGLLHRLVALRGLHGRQRGRRAVLRRRAGRAAADDGRLLRVPARADGPVMRVAHQGSAPLARAAMMARSAVGGVAEFRWWARAHCDVARLLGARMGLTGPVQLALRHLYERWDGKGMPGELRGQQMPLAVRLMQVAQDADMAWQQGGDELASGLLAQRAGSGLDPAAVAVFLALGDQVYAGLDAPSIWDEVDARRARAAAGGGRGPDRRVPVRGRGLRRPEEHVDDRPLPRRRRAGPAGRGLLAGLPPADGDAAATGRRWCTTSAGSRCRSGCGPSRAR